jgi:hypothetical protein
MQEVAAKVIPGMVGTFILIFHRFISIHAAGLGVCILGGQRNRRQCFRGDALF